MVISQITSRLVLITAISVIGVAAHAQITTYDFTGAPGNQASTAASGVASGLVSSVLDRGPGVTAGAAANSISSSAWSTAGIDLNDYYQFTLTPDSGQLLTLTSMDFSERRSGTGIRDIEVRSSLDSFGASVATFNVPDDTLVRRQTVNFGAGFSNLSGPVTVRIYGYTAEAAAGTWRLGVSGGTDNPNSYAANLLVFGSLTAAGAAPEPGTIALLGLAVLPGVAFLRRRK